MIRFVVPYILYSAIALVCIFLQSQLFSHVQIFNAKPDLLLLVLVMSSLKSDWKNGVALGLLLGFWIDLLNAGFFGTNMVVYGLVGVVCGLVGERFPDRTYEGYFFTVVAASLLSGFLTLAVFQLVGADLPTGQMIFGTIIPMTFYTSLLAFLCLPLIYLYRRGRGRKVGRIDLLGNGIIFVRGNEKVDMKKVAHERSESRRRREESRKRRAAEIGNRRDSLRERDRRGRASSGRERRGAGSAPARRDVSAREQSAFRRSGDGSARRTQGDYRVAPRDRNKDTSSKRPRSYPNRRPRRQRERRKP